MMEAENEVIDSTRRCLFPPDVNRSFESELDSTAMIHATNPTQVDDESLSLSIQSTSPTTVFECFPSFAMEKKRSLQSTIVMGDDGAEVTLSMAKLTLVTPEKTSNASHGTTPIALRQVRNSSLMDVDWTPTPPPSKDFTRERHNNFGDGWCGNPSANCVFDDEYEVSYDPNLEEIIASLLGDDSEPLSLEGMRSCSGWQEWSFSFKNSTNQDVEGDGSSIEAIRRNLRKRVLNLKTRKSKVHQLRRDLSPFSKSPGRRSPQLSRSRSFSVSDHQSAIVRRSTEVERHQHSFSSVLQLCTLPENTVSESPMLLRYNGSTDREDACYDSDPEDFAHHRSPLRRFPKDKENLHTHSYSPRVRTKDLSNEFDHSAVVQEFLNRTFTLAYHPCGANERPVGVDAWLERGQRLNALIPPKWMWRPKSNFQNKKKGPLIRAEAVRSLELLDISRILKIDKVDRNLYPFAKPNKCILVRNIDGHNFCFEAKSTEERDLVAFSLRLVIARFGAMVIATDYNIYDEFFANENGVPGEAPDVVDLVERTSNSEDPC